MTSSIREGRPALPGRGSSWSWGRPSAGVDNSRRCKTVGDRQCHKQRGRERKTPLPFDPTRKQKARNPTGDLKFTEGRSRLRHGFAGSWTTQTAFRASGTRSQTSRRRASNRPRQHWSTGSVALLGRRIAGDRKPTGSCEPKSPDIWPSYLLCGLSGLHHAV